MARRPGTSGKVIFIIGNIVFAILGLVIGYFLLVQIRPDMNVLGLNVPNLKEMEIPKVPDNWPSYDWDPTKPYTRAIVAPAEAANDPAPVADEPDAGA